MDGLSIDKLLVASSVFVFELMINLNLTSLRDISRKSYFRHIHSYSVLAGEAEKRNRLNQGLFPGDGTHRPAFVAFSGGDCYVNPFPDMAPDSVLTRFWYVNGSLMPESPVDLPSYGHD